MKKSRKIMSVLLVVAMLFTLVSPAMAADTTYTITINNSETGHTYEAYQIFAGDLHDGVLSNITWGSGVNGDNLLAALKTNPSYESCTSAEAVANVLKGFENDSAELNAFAKIVGKHLGTAADTANTVTDEKYTLDSLTAGYYLVKDKDGSQTGNNNVYTGYILKVVKNTTASPKLSSKPTVEKKVDDKNDSNTVEDAEVWQDSADYDIGDNVPFQLKATLANNVSEYTTYKIVFHDTLSAGLTYNNDAKVMFNGEEVTSNFTITPGKGSLTISCDNVKAFGATDGSVITVEYTAKLNNQATIGSAGNENKVRLEYSNNPNGEGTGKTEEDIVKVFTYKVIVNKVTQKYDAEGNLINDQYEELPGAGFTLYKKDTSGSYVAVGEEVKGAAMTTFTWTGLDDGDYKLVETTTPAGYNTINPIEFTITAEHETESDNPQLTSLSGGNLFTGEVSTGTLSADVVNNSGATLPETGGIGTTIFYVIGGALVLGAAVLLVTRRRMAE